MSEGVLTALIVAAGTALNILVALYREGRTRKWDIEDRRLSLEEAKAHAALLAADLAQHTSADARRLLGKLAENTAISTLAVERADAAYKEANTVNLKIASIGLKAVDDKPLSSHEPEI